MTRSSQHMLYDAARLRALAASTLLNTEAEPAFDRFTRAAALLTRAPMALISLLGAEQQFVKSSFGVDAARAMKSQPVSSRQYCQYVVTNNRTLLVDDTHTHSALPQPATARIQAYAGAPIHCDGEPIGTLCVVSQQARVWSPEETEVLETLAAAVDTEIALRIAKNELKSRPAPAPGSASDIPSSTEAGSALLEAEEQLRLTVDLSPIGIALVSPDGKWLRVNDAICSLLGYTRDDLLQTSFQSVTHPDDLESDTRLVQQLLAGEISSYQLEKRYVHRRGHSVWGLLTVSLVRNVNGEPAFFISQVQDISERRKLEEQIRESSLQDELTGLQNRRGFMMLGNQALNTAARYGRGLVLLFADLNGLKTINDELGHEAGDRQIVAMAETMRATFRRADIIARLGGDEFVFLGEADEAFALTAESKLQAAIDAYNQREPAAYPLSASIGTVSRPGGPGPTLQELMAAADSRMYSAKRKFKAQSSATTLGTASPRSAHKRLS